VSTTLSYGTDPHAKYIAAYFRHSFQVADPKHLGQLQFLIRSDDGIVVYVNGKEVARNNLPEGEVKFSTTAVRPLEGADERFYRRFKVEPSALVEGKNTVAVEVHQCDAASSDLYLDVILKVFDASEDARPVFAPKAKEAVEAYRTKHFVGPELTIPDGYVDGGRGMKFEADSHVSSHREVLIVDRAHDALLQELIKFAKSDALKALEPLERVKRLAARVVAASDLSERWIMDGVVNMQEQFAGESVRIGDVPKYCGAMVCRHRSLLLKILGDEAGLHMALVRGNYRSGRRILGGHAWNELHLDDGTKFIVDAMQDEENRVMPVSKGDNYVTVENKPSYKAPVPEKAEK
jgi:hypothetical protein